MKINQINNLQINYKGYPSESTERFVARAVSNSCSEMVERGNVITHELNEVRLFGKGIICQINHILSECHPDTIMDFVRSKKGNHFILRNKKLPKKFYVNVSDIINPSVKSTLDSSKQKPHTKSFSELNFSDLSLLKQFIDMLQQFSPKELDLRLYEQAIQKLKQMAQNTGFFGQMRTTVSAIKIDKFGKSIGVEESTVFRDAMDWINDAQIAKDEMKANKRLKKKQS